MVLNILLIKRSTFVTVLQSTIYVENWMKFVLKLNKIFKNERFDFFGKKSLYPG